MSDKVIDLLRPCRPAYVPRELLDEDDDMDAEDEEAMDGDDFDLEEPGDNAAGKGRSVLRLRLANLSVLDLSGCQRVSGDAIVAALRDRDEFALGCSFGARGAAMLDEVKVNNCHRFTAHHEAALAEVLGSRFMNGNGI
jgi:hypothetical protein